MLELEVLNAVMLRANIYTPAVAALLQLCCSSVAAVACFAVMLGSNAWSLLVTGYIKATRFRRS